ncbi:MAG: UDP-N-acetylmuramate dehydrogenase [Rhodocyclaceae bacterium]|nr:UDP-N-acetylmuramate dehydrogenase [Rhodocyclaceae bacterium]
MQIQHNADLRRLNTFGVAARAVTLVTLRSAGEARDLLRQRALMAAPMLMLGGGSNILFTRDWDGVVVVPRLLDREVDSSQGDTVTVVAGAGEDWDGFVRWTLGLGLAGLENLSLIPGSVGAAPIQNIGAYGVELRDRLLWVETFDWQSGRTDRLYNADCGFGYRDSVFKHELAGRLVTRVAFRLSRTPDLELDYGDIRQELADRQLTRPTPLQVAEAVCAIRRRKLPDPAHIGNAGSFFRNPVIAGAHAADLREAHPAMPQFAALGGAKVPAGWLIEACGWKGRREGDAGVHADHALVLVNHGKATGAQIHALALRVVDSVRERFGITLEPEVRVV